MSTEEILHELNNKVYGIYDILGAELWLTQSLIGLWIAMGIILTFAICVRISMKHWSDKPKGLQNVAELIVETFDNYAVSIVGKENRFLGNYFFGVAILIWTMNLSGFWLTRPPTADLSVTAGLALVTFILIHYLGMTRSGKHYFKEFVSPSPIMLPLHLISELALPVSLAFRLFGSTIGGFIIITLVYSLMPSIFLKIGFPVVLHGYFDFFAGSLQAFIFLTLSLTFIKGKLPE